MYLHIGDDVVVALADLVAIIAADSMEQHGQPQLYAKSRRRVKR
jgi:hypothetical protein